MNSIDSARFVCAFDTIKHTLLAKTSERLKTIGIIAAIAFGLLTTCWLLWGRCWKQSIKTDEGQGLSNDEAMVTGKLTMAPKLAAKAIHSDALPMAEEPDVSDVTVKVPKEVQAQPTQEEDDFLSDPDSIVEQGENIFDDSTQPEEQDPSGFPTGLQAPPVPDSKIEDILDEDDLISDVHPLQKDELEQSDIEDILDEDDLISDVQTLQDDEFAQSDIDDILDEDDLISDVQTLQDDEFAQNESDLELPIEIWEQIINPTLQTHKDLCNVRQISRFFRDKVSPQLKLGYTLTLTLNNNFKDQLFKTIIGSTELARLVETIQVKFADKLPKKRSLDLMTDFLSTLEKGATSLTKFRKFKIVDKKPHRVAKRTLWDFISRGGLAVFPSLSEIDQQGTFNPVHFQRMILEQVPKLKKLSSVSIGEQDSSTTHLQGAAQLATAGNSMCDLIHVLDTQPHFKKNLCRLVLHQPAVVEDFNGQSLSRLEILSIYLASNRDLATRLEELEIMGPLGQASSHIVDILEQLPHLTLLGLQEFNYAMARSLMKRPAACARLQTLKIYDFQATKGLELLAGRLDSFKTLHILMVESMECLWLRLLANFNGDIRQFQEMVKEMYKTELPKLGPGSHLCINCSDFYYPGTLGKVNFFKFSQLNSFECLSLLNVDYFFDLQSFLLGKKTFGETIEKDYAARREYKEIDFGNIKRINISRRPLTQDKEFLQFLRTYHNVEVQFLGK